MSTVALASAEYEREMLEMWFKGVMKRVTGSELCRVMLGSAARGRRVAARVPVGLAHRRSACLNIVIIIVELNRVKTERNK